MISQHQLQFDPIRYDHLKYLAWTKVGLSVKAWGQPLTKSL